MEDPDWEKLEQTARDIRDNTVNPRSRTTYQKSYCRFLAWLVRNKSPLVPPVFVEALANTSTLTTQQLRSRIKGLITQDRHLMPLEFAALTAKDFVTWLVTLERKY